MKGNTLLSLLKFFIIIYLIILLIKIILPLGLTGLAIYLLYKYVFKKVKNNKKKEFIKEKTTIEESVKKDEYKNYIINELYVLSEKCNQLEYSKKAEFLKEIDKILVDFTERYDRIVDNSYKSELILELDNEEKIKTDFINKIVKLEEEINTEIEKESKKRDVHDESSKLKSSIGKKLNSFKSSQIGICN